VKLSKGLIRAIALMTVVITPVNVFADIDYLISSSFANRLLLLNTSKPKKTSKTYNFSDRAIEQGELRENEIKSYCRAYPQPTSMRNVGLFINIKNRWNTNLATSLGNLVSALRGNTIAGNSSSLIDPNTCNSASNVVIYIPEGTYEIGDTVVLPSCTTLIGDGRRKTHIKISKPSPDHAFQRSGAVIEILREHDVRIEGLFFDNGLNYPDENTTSARLDADLFPGVRDDPPKEFPEVGGINIRGSYNVEIFDNVFERMSRYSVESRFWDNGTLRVYSNSISVHHNRFERGAYSYKVILLSSGEKDPITLDEDYGYSKMTTVNTIFCNEIYRNGPFRYPKPGISGQSASSDGIQYDGVYDSDIHHNIVTESASNGIRIEDSISTRVYKNLVVQTGAEAIIVYRYSRYNFISDNTILGWGRTLQHHNLRKYSDRFFLFRNVPHREFSPLHQRLEVTENDTNYNYILSPYSLEDVDLSTVPEYLAHDDYYRDPENLSGILPFRGLGAIGVVWRVRDNYIENNIIVGNINKDSSGKYLQASDYGISMVHATNVQSASETSLSRLKYVGATVTGNIVWDVRSWGIYAPKFLNSFSKVGYGLRVIESDNQINNNGVGNLIEY